MTVWLNWLRRTIGRPEIPPATSGATSVLFVLQSAKGGLTFKQLHARTQIEMSDLGRVLEALERQGRIAWVRRAGSPYKIYSIVHHAKQGN